MICLPEEKFGVVGSVLVELAECALLAKVLMVHLC